MGQSTEEEKEVMKQPNITPVRVSGIEAYQLVENYRYAWTLASDGILREITVPRSLVYDGASAPRIVWTLSGILPDGLIRAAALVHDFLYIHAGKLPRGCYGCLKDGVWVDLYGAVWSRKDADRMFARLMREAGVSKTQRRLAYTAVRLFGGGAWGKQPVKGGFNG